MILFKKAAALGVHLSELKGQGHSLGFVPTMGALHPGHLSLINASRLENPVTISSIFVNPTQFNDPKDFQNYPTTIEKDIDGLEKAGCDILFLPAVPEMYPNGTGNSHPYELGYLETVLEGKFRPGHFQGVCMVVDRLLQIIPADNLYLGQKDYQQCMVLKKLAALKHSNTKINICPTLREPDGLAMSSRNLRLTANDRKKASTIFETLEFLKNELLPGGLQKLKERALHKLTGAGFKVDYIEIADANTLELIDNWDGKVRPVALIAAFTGDVRLIDNMVLR